MLSACMPVCLPACLPVCLTLPAFYLHLLPASFWLKTSRSSVAMIASTGVPSTCRVQGQNGIAIDVYHDCCHTSNVARQDTAR